MKLIFVAFAVLAVFSGQSDAGVIDFIGNIGTAIGNGFSAFVDSLEKAFSEGKEHKVCEEVKKHVQQLAIQSKDHKASDTLLNGFENGINAFKKGADIAYEGLKKANSMSENPESAIQNLASTFIEGAENIRQSGDIFLIALGAAKAISESGATQGLNQAAQRIIEAADVAFSGLEASKELAILGLESGNDVSENETPSNDATTQAILAAVRGLQSIEAGIFNLVKKSAEEAFDAINNELSPAVKDSEVESEKDSAAAGSPKCANAIKAVEKSAEEALTEITSPIQLEAIKVIRDGIIDALKTIARAGTIGYSAMDDAKNISNPKSARAIVEKGIGKTKKECVVAIAIGQTTFGIALQIIGPVKDDTLFGPAMQAMELGRVALIKGLDNTQKLANLGIENNALEVGVDAGHNGVATSGFSAYASIFSSAVLAFEGIVKSQQ